MKGASGILVIVIGLVILWAIVVGAGPCLGGAFACLTGSKGPSIPAAGVQAPPVLKVGR